MQYNVHISEQGEILGKIITTEVIIQHIRQFCHRYSPKIPAMCQNNYDMVCMGICMIIVFSFHAGSDNKMLEISLSEYFGILFSRHLNFTESLLMQCKLQDFNTSSPFVISSTC